MGHAAHRTIKQLNEQEQPSDNYVLLYSKYAKGKRAVASAPNKNRCGQPTVKTERIARNNSHLL
jgi:hypothetical protein